MFSAVTKRKTVKLCILNCSLDVDLPNMYGTKCGLTLKSVPSKGTTAATILPGFATGTRAP